MLLIMIREIAEFSSGFIIAFLITITCGLILFNIIRYSPPAIMESGLDKLSEKAGKIVSIEDVKNNLGQDSSITIINIGTSNISMNELAVYSNEIIIENCNWSSGKIINVGQISTCKNSLISNCTNIRVTSPGGEDVMKCE